MKRIAGFTLIDAMLVIAFAAGVFAIFAPLIFGSKKGPTRPSEPQTYETPSYNAEKNPRIMCVDGFQSVIINNEARQVANADGTTVPCNN